jgi:hypothetical protein
MNDTDFEKDSFCLFSDTLPPLLEHKRYARRDSNRIPAECKRPVPCLSSTGISVVLFQTGVKRCIPFAIQAYILKFKCFLIDFAYPISF